ncbi:MAG: glycosyltransferase [Candidatus Hydrogenedentes bacterium]|nr:glycosyltransferase [Candidatus Hydrogenedentota bacterium]
MKSSRTTSPDMNTLAVSILLPFRNAAKTLDTAVASIRAQTFTDWELLLIDDGSRDESSSIARHHASEDRRIRVLCQDPLGIVEALRLGSREARGRYLARMDADDVSLPSRLQQQYLRMEDEPCLGMIGTQVRMAGPRIGSGRKRYETWMNALCSHEAIIRELFVECPIAHPAFMMRRTAFDEAGGYQDRGWAEDYDLVMRLWLAGVRFANVGHVLLEWREQPGRLSMRDPRYSPERFRDLKRRYLECSYMRGPMSRTFIQWGAGEVGKLWLREWTTPVPAAVVDINPRKIGRRIHGITVISPDELPPPGHAFTVIAVGAPGARDEIRDWMTPRGYIELEDYLFIA